MTTSAGGMAPSPAQIGDIWFDPATEALNVFVDKVGWQRISPLAVDSKGHVETNSIGNPTITIINGQIANVVVDSDASDRRGMITFDTTGSIAIPIGSSLFKVTYFLLYDNPPYVVIGHAGGPTNNANYGHTAADANGFTVVNLGSVPAPTTNIKLHYHVLG